MATAEVIIPVNIPNRMETKEPKKRAPAVSKRKGRVEPDAVPPPIMFDALPDETREEMQEAEERLASVTQKEKVSKKLKVMSASIPSMAVGDVRKCLNQIRKAGSGIRENHLLWNGWPAGRFALLYLIGNYSNKKLKNNYDDDSAEGTDVEEKLDEADSDANARDDGVTLL